MRYLIVAEAYRDLERLSSRLALTERLAALVADTPAGLLPTVCYLCQGLIAPEWAGVDLGLAEKLAVRAVAAVAGVDAAEVAALVREEGDLGQAAERLLAPLTSGPDGRAAGPQLHRRLEPDPARHRAGHALPPVHRALARRQSPRGRHHHPRTDRAIPHRPAHTNRPLKEIREAVSDRGGSVRSQGDGRPRGAPPRRMEPRS